MNFNDKRICKELLVRNMQTDKTGKNMDFRWVEPRYIFELVDMIKQRRGGISCKRRDLLKHNKTFAFL
jgi:hypothetical protein